MTEYEKLNCVFFIEKYDEEKEDWISCFSYTSLLTAYRHFKAYIDSNNGLFRLVKVIEIVGASSKFWEDN